MSAPLVLRQGCQERRAAWDPLTGASPGLCSGGSLVGGGGGVGSTWGLALLAQSTGKERLRSQHFQLVTQASPHK